MRRVLTSSSTGCRVLRDDVPHCAVPYIPGPSTVGLGSQNAGYMSLVEHPELIDGLAEVAEFPPLARVLREINRAGSGFETFGCGPGRFTRASNPGFTYCGAYLHVMFGCRMLNFAVQNHLAVATEFARRWPPVRFFGIDVIVEPLDGFFAAPSAWALNFELAGVAASEEEAWANAARGAEYFLGVFQSLNVAEVLALTGSKQGLG